MQFSSSHRARAPRAGRIHALRASVAAVAGLAVLAGGAAAPSWASSLQASELAALGGFALGDGLEGLIDTQTGALSFALPVAGISVGWDSRASATRRSALGNGWTIAGVAHVDTEGGVRVAPSSGGVYEADASLPSGLSGYALGNVVFSQTEVSVPGRLDGLRGAEVAAFVLEELGGLRTYFSADGDPIVRIDPDGNRTDWEWAPGHRLVRATDVAGVVSVLDWSDPARVEVATAVGLPGSVTATIELEGGRVTAVVDATGGRAQIGYDRAGSVVRLAGVSGAATEVSWQGLADGQRAVEQVRVLEAATGAELSSRTWEARMGLASGWPATSVPALPGVVTGFAGGRGEGYTTAVSDGASTVVSAFDGDHLLLERQVSATTTAGALTVQRQAYTYPDRDDRFPGGVPPQYAQPTVVTVTHFDASGGHRETSESFAFDDLGRPIRQAAEDGSTTETEYDEIVPAGGKLPIGLPVFQRVTAADGLVEETRHELNPARTAPVVTETFAGTRDDEELTRVGRREFEVDADGFVQQERVFPQGGDGTPVVTVHVRDTDLTAGRVTVSSTVAAGTASEATTTTVSDLVHGGALEETGPAGAGVSTAYDPAGRPVEQVDVLGQVTRLEYRTRQQHGENAMIVTGPDEVVTTRSLDVLGRVTRIADNILDGEATPGHVRVAETRDYPEPGVLRVTDAWGATTTVTRDLYGRIVRSVAANGLTEVTVHDDVANVVTSGLTATGDLADALSTTTSRMNTRGEVTETSGTRADGSAVPPLTTTLDGFGRSIETTDGIGTTSTGFDVFGNPVTMTMTPDRTKAGPGEGVTPVTATREFDAFGAGTVKTLAAGEETRHGGVVAYDELGRATTSVDQDGGTATQAYTPDGLIESTVTSYGQVVRNEYHAGTRAPIRTTTTSPVGEAVSTDVEHDPITGKPSAVFDPADRAGTEITYDADAWGNVTRISYPDGRVIEHDYDAHGRLEATTDVVGNITGYGYDQAGLMTTARQVDSRGNPLAEVAYRYDTYGRLVEQTRGNGIITTYAYTSANQVACETAVRPDGRELTRRTYDYDERGNLTSRVDARPNPGTGVSETTATAYRYDVHDRLVRSTVHDGATTDSPVRTVTEYQLSVGGDIQSERVTERPGTEAEGITTRVFAYGATGTLTSVTTTHADGSITTETQDYDAAGNLTRAMDGTRYVYNAVNQRVSETTPGGETIRTGYWASGQRAGHTDDGSSATTVFHWNGTTLVNDTHTDTADGVPRTAGYLMGVGRNARTLDDEASTAYFEADQHGNVVELTSADGEVATSYAYTDYGVTTARPHVGNEPEPARALVGDASRNPFQYAGEYTDVTGTQYLQARSYDPVSMRMTSVDPAPRHNRYHYADLNPIMLADPSGRVPALPTWTTTALLAGFGAFLAIVGAVGAYLGVAVAASIGATTIGANAVLYASAVVATFDLVATGLTIAHEFEPEFLDDHQAFILGAVAAAAGVTTMFAGWASRAIHAYARTDIADLIKRGASKDEAMAVIAIEKRLSSMAQRAFQTFGISFREQDLRFSLHRWAAAESRSARTGAWNAKAHLRKLSRFEHDLNEGLETARRYRTSREGGPRIMRQREQVRVSDEAAAMLEGSMDIEIYAGFWPQGIDMAPYVRYVQGNLEAQLHRVYGRYDKALGSPEHATGLDYITSDGRSVLVDKEWLGRNGLWNYQRLQAPKVVGGDRV